MARSQMILQDMPRNQRQSRTPKHPWYVRTKPWALTPIALIPVLPGETLKYLNWQARVVTDPIKSKLIGWQQEYYWFYVKHRDLAERDTLTDMMTAPGTDISGIDDITSSTDWYHGGTAGNINWVKLCTIAVTEEYFRQEGQAWDAALIDSYPAVRWSHNCWADSINLIGVEDDYDVSVSTAGDNAFTMKELQTAMDQYQLLLMNGLTTQSYEEYLMSYGVKPEKTQIHVPELLRFTRHWQYPSNTVDPADGSVTSAVSWSIQERIDKDRRFTEPGFIIGFTVSRPKIYMSNQRGHISALMNDVYRWLPATLSDPRVARKMIDNANAVTNGITTDFWIDFKDLFVYGEQFTNVDLTTETAEMNGVAIPPATGSLSYPSEAMAIALFTSGVEATAYVRQDGIAAVGIMGHVTDPDPRFGNAPALVGVGG